MKNFNFKSLNFLLKIPSHHSDDIYEEAKYTITCKLFNFITISMLLISLINVINYTPSKLIPTATVGVACFFANISLKKTGNYKNTAIFANIIAAIILIFSLHYNPQNPHVIEGLWMINNIYFVFLTLGKRLGTVFTLFHGLNLSLYYLYYYSFIDESIINSIQQNSQSDILEICISIFLAFLTFIYFNWLAISTNVIAARKIEVSSSILKEQFETISKQNEEKSVMLKEIHHRVKNNLQLIISLLRLQSREFTNQETIDQFNDAVNRIVTISLVHEKMYQTDDLSQLDLKSYFKNLGNDIIHAHRENDQIKLNLHFEIEKIKLKPIVPIALIFNELISNSLKHSKQDEKQLLINFELKMNKSDELEMNYTDNGTWKEPGLQNSFGLELIDALSQQIEAKMTITRKPKTQFHFIMKNPTQKVYVGQ